MVRAIARRQGRRLLHAFALAVALAAAAASGAHASGITNSGNDLRDGWYPDQPALSPDAVSDATFGQLWSQQLDGQIYAQPLVVGDHVIVATERNKVYSLDRETGDVEWADDLGAPFPATKIGPSGCPDLKPDIGVTGTPVIDPATNTIYLTHKTYASGSTDQAAYWMDALDADTGQPRPHFPRILQGNGQNAPTRNFMPTTELQRPGLLLLDGIVYAAFGGHCDIFPYQGWVMGVNPTTGNFRARWSAVMSGFGAGIWQSGAGIMSDGPGRMFVSTGNGGAPDAPGDSPAAGMFGESIVRLDVQPDGTLKAADFFAPADAQHLDDYDADFASGGVTGLRDDVFGTSKYPHLALAAGKAGYVYLLNRDDLGGYQNTPDHGDDVVARVGPYGGVWSRPGVWPGDGGWIALPTASPGGGEHPAPGGSAGYLKLYRYRVSHGQPSLDTPVQSDDAFGFGSGAPVITSDGLRSGSATLWAIWMPNGSGANAQLRAYDAVPRDGHLILRRAWPIGVGTKFAMPGIGSGRVYVGTREGRVLAFGSPVQAAVTAAPATFPDTTVGETSTETVTLAAAAPVTITGVSGSGVFAAVTDGLGLPRTLAAGDTLDVPATFAPVAAGVTGGTLTVTTDQGPFAFTLTGAGQLSDAQLTIAPGVVSFGGAIVGENHAGTVTISNTGGQPMTIEGVDLPSAPFSVDDPPDAGDVIAPNTSRNVTVRYRPTAVGDFSADLVVHTSAGTGTVGLLGSAGAGPRLSVTPADGWQFGDVAVGDSAVAQVAIANTGDSPMTLTKSKPPVGSAFTVLDPLDEATQIEPGETRTVRIRFTPVARGDADDAWTINAADGTGVHAIPVHGHGLAPGEPTGPASVALGDAALGATASGTATFANGGDLPITVTGFDGPAAPFAVDDVPAAGTVVAPGATLAVHARFSSGVPGAAAGTFTLRTSGGDRTVALSARAVTSGLLDAGAGWSFGDVAVGTTKTVDLTLRNAGPAPLTVLASAPPADARFAVVGEGLPVGLTLAPGASRTVTVAFSPAAAGGATAYWTLATTAAAGARLVPLSGNGVVATTPETPPLVGQGPPVVAPPKTRHRRVDAGLTLSRPRLARDGRRLTLRGRVVAAAAGTLSVRVKVKAGNTTTTTVASLRLRRRSTYAGTVRLAHAAARWSRVAVRVAYAGSGSVRPATTAFTLVRVRAR